MSEQTSIIGRVLRFGRDDDPNPLLVWRESDGSLFRRNKLEQEKWDTSPDLIRHLIEGNQSVVQAVDPDEFDRTFVGDRDE